LSILLSSYPFLFYCSDPILYLHSFPTRRSSDLTACSRTFASPYALKRHISDKHRNQVTSDSNDFRTSEMPYEEPGLWDDDNNVGDRKSTRLNSSHLGISYAVFCLKKKKKKNKKK